MSGTFSDDYVRFCAGLIGRCTPTDADLDLVAEHGEAEVLAKEVLDLRARVAELEATIADTLTRQADQARWSREVEEMQRSLADGHKRSAYQRGAESMRERAAAALEEQAEMFELVAAADEDDPVCRAAKRAAGMWRSAAAAIRALPLDDDAGEGGPVLGPPARPLDEWHDDHGAVLWWALPVCEPPYVGSPDDDDFPDSVTHWTPIVVPSNGGERG